MNAPHDAPKGPVTRAWPFFSCSPAGDTLFSVQPNVSQVRALEQASSFLAVALSSLSVAMQEQDETAAAGARYMVTLAKALVDAATIVGPLPIRPADGGHHE